jgi:hypothetical protein
MAPNLIPKNNVKKLKRKAKRIIIQTRNKEFLKDPPTMSLLPITYT